ncbi:hypothetical protein [Pseudohongiella spirulinae]|uniref:hypothetical protein n=1 Tax=Pseudohongiella spirulinae TaxID=1249552 RepID=UPI0007178C91|nr:hypothetical protein [Pseudohongiella spirulinae]
MIKTHQLSLIGAPIFVFTTYLCVAVWLLLTGHPHEDAYILNTYARNLADGYGISYFAGGAPAEGATDFLWMLLLAMAERVGIDGALFAHILNGAGLSIITGLAVKLSGATMAGWRQAGSVALLVLLITTSQVTQAALAGFSTGFYCGAIALLFYLLYRPAGVHLVYIPMLGLVTGLIRPDGVIIGITATLIGAIMSRQTACMRRYLYVSGACLCLGIIYFVWRIQYFGYWLPLPLIVKSADAQVLPGLAGHVDWAARNFYLGAAALTVFLLSNHRWRLLTASLPVGVLLIALLFANQSQNIADRFQAPATTVLILWCAIYLGALISRHSKAIEYWNRATYASIVAMLVLAVNQAAQASVARVSYLREHEYINSFPYFLSYATSSQTRFAITEAGRFSFWLPGQKFDLIGLNTPEFALTQVTPESLAALRADLYFAHLAGSADFSSYCQQNVCELTRTQIESSLTPDSDAWQHARNPVFRAPRAVLSHYLHNSDSYRAYVVRYNKGYHHLYLLNIHGQLAQSALESALTLSFQAEGRLSYWDLRRASKLDSGLP